MTGATLLSAYLNRSGKQQKELAAAAGLKPDIVSRYISGERVPGVTNAVAICRATDGAVPVESWARKTKRRRAA